MTGRRRSFDVASTGSVLDEMYGTTPEPVEDQPPAAAPPSSAAPATADVPASATVPTDDVRKSATKRTPDVRVSASRKTRVQHEADTNADQAPLGRSAAGTRTPAGMTRHTIYIAADVAARLDAAADQLGKELRGLIPKHRILAALIEAGVGQARPVAAQLRAELLQGLSNES